MIPSVQPFAVSVFVLDFKVRNIERANCFNRACKCIVHGFAPCGSATFSPHRSQGAKNLRSIKPLSFAVIAIAHCALKQILRERPAGRLAVQYSTAFCCRTNCATAGYSGLYKTKQLQFGSR